MATRKKRIRCLTCKKPAEKCGLCGTCYQAAWRRINANQITREEAEENNLILPSRHGSSNPWTEKAAKALNK